MIRWLRFWLCRHPDKYLKSVYMNEYSEYFKCTRCGARQYYRHSFNTYGAWRLP